MTILIQTKWQPENISTYATISQLDGTPRFITIDYERDELLSEAGIAVAKDQWTVPGENSPQEAFARAACAFSDNSEHAQRIYDYVSNLWFMFATPVVANGGTTRGLPISCFVNKVDDSRKGLGDHYAENLWLSTSGGGCGTDWSSVRSVGTSTSKGNQTTGVIPFIKVADSLIVASWQGSTRRGAGVVYLSVRHPEILEFIEIRKPTGDTNRRSLNIHNAVSIPDAFMEAVENGDKWQLVDPHTQEVTEEIDARELWMKILTLRVSTGEPMLFFEDTANNALPEHLKAQGLRINSSNLCTEIMLPTAPDRTAVCCLSSVNLEKFEEWSTNDLFIEDLMRMLDNVLTVFIDEAPPELWRAVESACYERSVGLGAMGFHSFLQSKGIPFEGVMASVWNRKMFFHLHNKTDLASMVLAHERGACPDAEGYYERRFSHTMALAPNATSSLVCGSTSPSIEPYTANAFTQKTHSGVFLIKNKHLDNLLRNSYSFQGAALEHVWTSIVVNEGSVQHLEFLLPEHKELFKTAFELDQSWIIEHASVRQPFIDQGQSVNLFVSPTISKGELHKLHKDAWKKKLKSLYYCRSKSVGRTETIGANNVKEINFKEDPEGCLSCEG